MVLVIICHIMQHEQSPLANWFNVGVQIFLCISGYLYGLAPKRSTIEFYHDRFLKILIPFYIAYLSFALVEYVFFREVFDVLRFLCGLFCRAFISGAGHLWYVSLILLCYILTPLLQLYRDRYIKDKKSWALLFCCCILVVSISFGLYNSFFSPAWLCCYVIGFFLGANKDYFRSRTLLVLFGILALLSNGVQIYIDYFTTFKFKGYMETAYKFFSDYSHTMLGVFLFLLIKITVDRIHWAKMKNLKKVLDLTDKYSYECYLVHQFVILGPCSLMAITKILPLNILLIVLVILLLTVTLKCIEMFVMKNVMKYNGRSQV